MIPISNIDSAFWPKLVQGAQAMGASPISLALVMLSESSINPKARNPSDTSLPPVAVGLNQLSLPSRTFQGVVGDNVDPDAFLTWPASVQLDYALKYFRGVYSAHPGALQGGARDLYWLNFMPATYVAGAGDDHVITNEGWAVSANPSLADPDGVIRAGGLKRALDAAANASYNAARWQAAVQNINELLPQVAVSSSGAANAAMASITFLAAGGAAYLFLKNRQGKAKRKAA